MSNFEDGARLRGIRTREDRGERLTEEEVDYLFLAEGEQEIASIFDKMEVEQAKNQTPAQYTRGSYLSIANAIGEILGVIYGISRANRRKRDAIEKRVSEIESHLAQFHSDGRAVAFRDAIEKRVSEIESHLAQFHSDGRAVAFRDAIEKRVSEIESHLAQFHSDGRAVALPVLRADAATPARREHVALPICRGHEADKVYYAGEVVTHAGGTFQAGKDTGQKPPHEDWICLAAAGRAPVVRGTYSADETYRSLDIVAIGGGSFIARRDHPGPCPGDGWQLIAGQGKTGRPGEPGRQGIRGPAGPAVEHLTVDDQGLLTLVNADGSTASLDLYPLLSKLQR